MGAPPLPPDPARVPQAFEMGRLVSTGQLRSDWLCRWCRLPLATVRGFLRCSVCDPDPYKRPSPEAKT